MDYLQNTRLFNILISGAQILQSTLFAVAENFNLSHCFCHSTITISHIAYSVKTFLFSNLVVQFLYYVKM